MDAKDAFDLNYWKNEYTALAEKHDKEWRKCTSLMGEVQILKAENAELKVLCSNHEKNRWDNFDLAVKRREEIEYLKNLLKEAKCQN